MPKIANYIDPKLPDMWVNLTTGEETERCPWLRKDRNQPTYRCTIHAVRPDVCRNFPVDLEQMQDVGCEMLEPVDLLLSKSAFAAKLRSVRQS